MGDNLRPPTPLDEKRAVKQSQSEESEFPDDGIQKGSMTANASRSVSRRTLCIGVGSAAVLFGMGALRFVGNTAVCRPPGGQDEAHLVSACIRCQKCYEACPHHVIVPARIEDGLVGVRTPTLDFNSDFCNYCSEEYNGVPRCVEVCPTEALQLPVGATAETVIIGRAVINEKECLAFRNTGCQFCYDVCPYEAIELDGEGKNPRPRVVNDKCNGCGACESVCVSLESGSIATGATSRAIVIKPLEAID